MRRTRFALAILAIAALGCSENGSQTTSPSSASGSIGIAVSPAFSAAATQAYRSLAAVGLEITNIHIVLTAPDGSVHDTTLAFPTNVEALQVVLTVPARSAGDTFIADIELRAADGTVLFSGRQSVIANATTIPGVTVPATVTIAYSGPGKNAKTVTLSPGTQIINNTGSANVTANAVDANGAVVPDLLVGFATSDPTVATVTSTGRATAIVTGTGKRGTVTITATTPLGVLGAAQVSIVPPASKVVVISGSGQTAAAGSTTAQPLIVEVQASDNLPVANIPVTFRAITTGASVGSATATTDATGRASTTLTLGRTAGAYQFDAASTGLTSASATATATTAPAAALTIASGDAQSTGVTTAFSSLAVKVVDQFGTAVSGATVQWTRISGAGTLAAATSTSNASGIATIIYTAGTLAGKENIRASLPNVTSSSGSVNFVESALAGPATRIFGAGQGQHAAINSQLPARLVARLADQYGNPVVNADVAFILTGNSNGRATLNPPVASTDEGGTAATTVTIGNVPGPFRITAAYGDLTFNYDETADGSSSTNSPGVLSGFVYNGVSQAVLSGATIAVSQGASVIATTTTASNGTYATSQLPGGVYDIQVSLSGFVTTSIVAQVINGNTVAEAVPLVPASTQPGSIAGTVLDATTNRAVTSSVTLELRAGLNATSGAALQTVTANSSAQYVFSGISAGTYTVLARTAGYANAIKTGISVGATTTGNQNLFISPSTAAGAVRIVLTWRSSPGDLDSHLTGPTGSDTSNRFHVFYAARGDCTALPLACLDQDVTSGNGPETMTISQVQPGRYRYGVQNYSVAGNGNNASDQSLSQSGAVVSVYISNVLVQTFAVPAGAGAFWSVFELNGSTITPINQIVPGQSGYLLRIPTGAGTDAGASSHDDEQRMMQDVRNHPKSLRAR